MVKVVEREKIDCDHLLGTFMEEEHFDLLIDEDVDVYLKSPYNSVNNEDNIILMFRKNFFTADQQLGAYEGLMEAAVQSQNRGLAAGLKAEKCLNRDWVTDEQALILTNLSKLVDNDSEQFKLSRDQIEQWKFQAKNGSPNRGSVWLGSEVEKNDFKFDKWLDGIFSKSNKQIVEEVAWINDKLVSGTTYANPVNSGIAGWFGRYPRIPYGRATSYTEHNLEKFKKAYPFLEQLSKGFAELLPNRYENQISCAQRLDQSYYVPNTPFTTITVNKNFRTAAHKDAGDLASGFSNLTVVAGKGAKSYSGGYLVLPEIRAAVNIRPGDLLLVANHDYMHGNTPIVPKTGDIADLERISLVCYFREDMLELGSKMYEDLRYQFVESRRKNPNHPLWWERWNGVSTGMWTEQEWYDFIKVNYGQEMLDLYHPESKGGTSLDDFFS